MSEPVITRKNAGFGDYYEVTQDGVFICEIGRMVTGARVHSGWYYRLASMKRESQKKYLSARAAWEAAKARLTPVAADALCDCYISVPAGNYPDLCAHCGKKARR